MGSNPIPCITQQAPMNRRKILTAISGLAITSGCIEDTTNHPSNNTTNGTTSSEEENEVEIAFTGVVDVAAPENTPTDTSEILFVEQPTKNRVIVAKTVQVHNGCAEATADAAQSSTSTVTVTFDSIDNSEDDIVCTTAIEQEQYGIGVDFDRLVAGTTINVVPEYGEETITYDVTNTNTESIKTYNESD